MFTIANAWRLPSVEPTSDQSKRRRRSAQQKPRASRAVPYKNLRHPYTPQTIWSEDEVVNVHNTALRVIEELGIKILLP